MNQSRHTSPKTPPKTSPKTQMLNQMLLSYTSSPMLDQQLPSSATSSKRKATSPQTNSVKKTRQEQLQEQIQEKYKENLEEYRSSCAVIANKTQMTLSEYKEHLIKLLNVLKSFNFAYYGNLDMNFNFFDENTLKSYKLLKADYRTDIIFPIEQDDFQKLYRNCQPIYKKSNLFLNTLMNQILYVKIIGNNLDCFLNGEQYFLFKYNKYLLCLPKYHCLDSISKNSNVSKILELCNTLNSFTENFPDEYDIIADNNNIHMNVLEKIRNYTDAISIHKLLYVILNNNYETISKQNNLYSCFDQHYYYFKKFDGPAGATSTLNINNYLNHIAEYRPLQLSKNAIKVIESAYKPSHTINAALQNFIKHNNDPITNIIINIRLKNVMQYVQANIADDYNKEDIYIFHGAANGPIHLLDENEVVLVSFLSCTFNIYIAIDYAVNNFNQNKRPYDPKTMSGFVYIFQIGKDIKYINFDDVFYQIVLLPGTKIKIKNLYTVHNITYVFCHVENADERYGMTLYKRLFHTEYLEKYSREPIIITKNKEQFPKCNLDDFKDSQVHFSAYNSKYVTINNNKIFLLDLYSNLLGDTIYKIQSIMYTIHSHFIKDCYLYFDPEFFVQMGLTCINNIIYTYYEDDMNYYDLLQNNMMQIKDAKKFDFNFNCDLYFVHSLLSNHYIHNQATYFKHKTLPNKFKMYITRNCALYDNYGVIRRDFQENAKPIDHILILNRFSENILKKLYENNYAYFNDLITQFHAKLEGFIDFVNDIKIEYISFVNQNLNISENSDEAKYLVNMIEILTNSLIIRSNYYRTNIESIKNELQTLINTKMSNIPQEGGKIEYMSRQSPKDIMMSPSKSFRQSPKDIMMSPSKSFRQSPKKNQKMDHLNNISLSGQDTIYHISELGEPYKTYYKDCTDKNGFVDVSNIAYTVSTKEFKRIYKPK